MIANWEQHFLIGQSLLHTRYCYYFTDKWAEKALFLYGAAANFLSVKNCGFLKQQKPEEKKNEAVQREGIRVGRWFMHPQEAGWIWPLRYLSAPFCVFYHSTRALIYTQILVASQKQIKYFNSSSVLNVWALYFHPKLLSDKYKLYLSCFIHAIL